MNIPSELKYSSDHEWVLATEDVVRIGITDYAQDSLGDIVFVQVPDIGSQVTKGESCGEIESTKSVSDLYAPISGKVVAVNELVSSSPNLINSDPYGDGWIIEVAAEDPAQLESLLDSTAYQLLIEG